ncbi:RlpA-like double-psi beta-barrel-protein domain-containing protein-containing protein [Cyathus striatus]|nr:RlpA-like double-psi beta-barrel-protein domain-containing protein-containing protein [Cyathus striatus]
MAFYCYHLVFLLSIDYIFNIFLFANAWITYPDSGLATLTHYTLPLDYVASCGCTPSSTHYPTAALSQMAYGSSTAYGPACGKCFNITLINPVIATPPFHPSVVKSITVKVTDLCPLSQSGRCNATDNGPTAAGTYLNFDLAYPSDAIPDDFFPSDEALYGYKDFGVWNISYQIVSCLTDWAGAKQASALGSIPDGAGQSVCCPANPTGDSNDTCPSYSDANGIPPDTTTSTASPSFLIPGFLVLFVLMYSISILLFC